MASLTCLVVPTACVSQSQRQWCKPSVQSAVLGSHSRTSALVRSHSSYSRRPTPRTLHRVSCSASDFEEGELIKGIKAGDKLKVKESRLVYHAPKHKDGLDIKGMEGTLIEVIEKYQGKQLSANLPYKTQFMIPKDEGKDMKLIVHLAAGEFDKTGEAET